MLTCYCKCARLLCLLWLEGFCIVTSDCAHNVYCLLLYLYLWQSTNLRTQDIYAHVHQTIHTCITANPGTCPGQCPGLGPGPGLAQAQAQAHTHAQAQADALSSWQQLLAAAVNRQLGGFCCWWLGHPLCCCSGCGLPQTSRSC